MRATSGVPPGARADQQLAQQLARDGRRRPGVEIAPQRRQVGESTVSHSSNSRLPVEAVEQAAESPVRLQRREHRAGGVPVAVAIEIARHQPVAQEQERGLHDVRQTVAAQGIELPGVEQPLDLAAVDAVLLARQADGPRRAVERGHPGGAVVGDDVARSRCPSSVNR